MPIIYLPGVSRADIRAIEECPKPLQPLAELQYRGVLWTHKNGRDWTVAGFLQSADGGLGIAVSGDTATKEALGRALLKLAYEPVARLKKEAPLKAAFFDELLNPDQARRLLLWLNDPTGYPKSLTPAEWYAFCELCKRTYGFHPVDDGTLIAAEGLGTSQGAWAIVWDRFNENPEGYPNLPELLRRARPERSIFENERALLAAGHRNGRGGLARGAAGIGRRCTGRRAQRIAQLEAEHGARRGWIWARLGRAPLAVALAASGDPGPGNRETARRRVRGRRGRGLHRRGMAGRCRRAGCAGTRSRPPRTWRAVQGGDPADSTARGWKKPRPRCRRPSSATRQPTTRRRRHPQPMRARASCSATHCASMPA